MKKYMKKYMKNIFWSEGSQKWIVDVPELPGCMTDGETPEKALENIECIITEWLETAQKLGRKTP